jgi:hypothetical protein
MKFTLRYLQPGEMNWEMIWGSVLGFVAAVGSAWMAFHLPTPQCVIYQLSGWPCLSCGGTRAARAVLHGDLPGALAWNPLVTAILVVAAMYVVYAATVCLFRLPRVRVSAVAPASAAAIRIGIVVSLTANWIYLIARFSDRG